MAYPTHADCVIVDARIHGLFDVWKLAEKTEDPEGRLHHPANYMQISSDSVEPGAATTPTPNSGEARHETKEPAIKSSKENESGN